MEKIPTAFPFESHFADVLGSHIHYIEEGAGMPMLFIHGIPTSNYVWRNIIPTLAENARCIAPDLIGMGQSGKPTIEYTIFDHIKYMNAFIDQLALENITLVLHGWGSVIGFDFAMRNQDKVKAIAFIEGYLRPTLNWEMMALPLQEITSIEQYHDSGYDLIMNSTYFIDRILPLSLMRALEPEELAYYKRPFLAEGTRRPLWQYLQDLPKGGEPCPVVDLIANYSKQLQQSDIPKLMLYGIPGFNTTVDTIAWARDHIPRLSLVDIGEALHIPQESNPALIAEALHQWYLDC